MPQPPEKGSRRMVGDKSILITTLIACCAILIGYLLNGTNYTQREYQVYSDVLSSIRDAMLQTEKSFEVGDVRIAVGYGACRDLFVKGSDVLGKMTPPDRVAHYGSIQSLSQLKEMYALFFSAGSAAERYVSNETLFQELLAMATKVPSHYFALGGNAPVMAARFAKEGAIVLLGATQDKNLVSELHPNVTVAGAVSASEEDDIHLIFEYASQEKWGKYTSPRANRFIIHSDADNPQLSSLEGFGSQLPIFKPHLLVIGGLQMMDNFPFLQSERQQLLQYVGQQMISQSKETLIHFEMASFTDAELLNDLAKHVIPNADSLGMNEQELPNLYNLLKFHNISVVSYFNPRVATVLDQMRDIFDLLGYKGVLHLRAKQEGRGLKHLTRLHVHTLAFQAIIIDIKGPWKNTRAAVTKAALTAFRHVCRSEEIMVDQFVIIMDEGFTVSDRKDKHRRVMFQKNNPVACWTEDNRYEVCVAPVLVCRHAQQTAGGGDNISASGLVLQV